MRALAPFRCLIFVFLLALPLAAQDAPGTATLTAQNQCAGPIKVNADYGSVGIQVTGTWSATLTPQVSIDGVAWATKQVTPSTADGVPQSTITTNNLYAANVGGARLFQICATAYTSGSAVISLQANKNTNPSARNNGPTGTVTSVAETVPAWLTVAGSPVTGAGTLAVAPTTGQTSHQVIGTCGSATTFAPCALVAGDIPVAIPIANVGSSGLSGTAPVTISAAGAIGCATCVVLGVGNAQTTTYQVLASDFSGFKNITVASGTFTITLVASGSQPTAGQFINVINYGSGVVTIAVSGQNINGAATSLSLPAANNAQQPSSAYIESDGTNYFATISGANAATLGGKTFAVPNPIGSTTPNTGAFTSLAAGSAKFNVNTSGLPTQSNNITLAGQGFPLIVGITSQKSETNTADASVLAVTPASAVGTYEACVAISVTSATSGVIGWTLSWTDSNGTAQSNIAQSLFQLGTAAPALTFTTSAAGNYSSCTPFDVNAAGAAITVKWVGGGTSAAKMSAYVTRII